MKQLRISPFPPLDPHLGSSSLMAMTTDTTAPSSTQISPNSRHRHLRTLLESHRADRLRIQQRAELRLAPNEMTEKLQAALAEIHRIEHEFHNFRTGASASLAAALDENEKLRKKLEKLLPDETTKPAEKELEVERLKRASIKKSPFSPARERKSLRLPFRKEPQEKERRKSTRPPIRFSRKWSTCF